MALILLMPYEPLIVGRGVHIPKEAWIQPRQIYWWVFREQRTAAFLTSQLYELGEGGSVKEGGVGTAILNHGRGDERHLARMKFD
jgi:hypothetical protein